MENNGTLFNFYNIDDFDSCFELNTRKISSQVKTLIISLGIMRELFQESCADFTGRNGTIESEAQKWNTFSRFFKGFSKFKLF